MMSSISWIEKNIDADYLFRLLLSILIDDSVFTHNTSSTKKFPDSSYVSTKNKSLKDRMTNFI